MGFKNIIEKFAVNYAHNSIQKSLYNEFNIDILTTTYTKTPKKYKKYMLYAHVPFCHTFCPYCSFHKYHYEQELAKIYFENLREEMRQVKEAGFDFSSLYVGGGTTLINEPELEKTLKLAKELFSVEDISAESDPNHISPESLSRFDGLIDRLSVGVQSFDNETLKRVGRYEKFGSAEETKRKLEKALGKIPVISQTTGQLARLSERRRVVVHRKDAAAAVALARRNERRDDNDWVHMVPSSLRTTASFEKGRYLRIVSLLYRAPARGDTRCALSTERAGGSRRAVAARRARLRAEKQGRDSHLE